ncbi:MAG: glycosyltransferase family 4 protein [Acidobacteria bacterium]|nr:glycosyltransferase family 4 protein [Acidobacteriota bacterium]
MRVLVTHERFLPESCGGCEYGVYHVASGLRGNGMGVRILTTGNPSLREYDGLETVRMPISRHRMNFAARHIEFHARDADLIQTSVYHAALPSFLAGRRLGKPVVLLVTALCAKAWLEMKGQIAGRAYRAWERFLLRRPWARIIFPSEHAHNTGLAMGIDPERCVTIYPGVDLKKFDPNQAKENHVLFVGKFERRKGVYDVVQLARALPRIPFRMIGWGPEESALRAAAPPNLAIDVLPPGTLMTEGPGGPLRQAFNRASIFLLPSRAESFGLVVVEAMAAGCAIVSTVALEFMGARMAAGDVGGMAEAIRGLWSDPPLARHMGRRNAELAAYYNWERFTRRLVEVYREVLSGSREHLAHA